MAAPIRVLHIVTYMGRGGLETLLMNLYRSIDREYIQFDFLVHREFRADYDDEIEALGGRIYRMPRLNPIDPRYNRSLLNFFKTHPEYTVVHSHLDCMSAIPLAAAKACGVPVRIAHVHSSSQDRNWKYWIKRYYAKKIPAVATNLFACSRAAGEWMLQGHDFTVLNNGIDTDRFSFSPERRAEIRRSLGLGDSLVLGHVGRFSSVKNHTFLLDIFAHLHKQHPVSKLLLVGDGECRVEIEEKAKTLGLTEDVVFAGSQSDVSPYYQAMDVFVFPSLYEGLGIVAVEAQTSGLPCVISDKVPLECAVTDGLVSVQSLENSPQEWAELILSLSVPERKGYAAQVAARGYDITGTAKWLQEFYLRIEG